ncbi:MAG: DUF4238 domain-containing protein [Prolixibacteraceae bacterium]|nr:DUF4238 domain-containing protein [Prolixibacteraceae bacterium]
MSTNKKNQHYIPKFYLRNFSFEGNNKQVGIYNLDRGFYFQTAPLKHQGSKDFFYGEDGVIEDLFSVMEAEFARIVNKLSKSMVLPKLKSTEHIHLLEFVSVMDLRNPIIIDYAANSRIELRRTVEALHPGKNIEESLREEISHKDAVALSLMHIKDAVDYSLDLELKLLINKTERPFITSDYPLVKYNQFLEGRKYDGGKTGFGCVGLQLILPINPELILILYDPKSYKVGYRKRKYLEITDIKSVEQLNLLQVLNCKSTLFFNQRMPEIKILKLVEKSRFYKRANVIDPVVYKGFESEEGGSNYISLGTTDCEIGLAIPGIKLISGINNRRMPNTMALLRENPQKLRILKERNRSGWS